MPTRIKKTAILQTEGQSSKVEILIADNSEPESFEEFVSVRVNVQEVETELLEQIQAKALQRTLDILRAEMKALLDRIEEMS